MAQDLQEHFVKAALLTAVDWAARLIFRHGSSSLSCLGTQGCDSSPVPTIWLVPPARFELALHGLVGRCLYRLGYGGLGLEGGFIVRSGEPPSYLLSFPVHLHQKINRRSHGVNPPLSTIFRPAAITGQLLQDNGEQPVVWQNCVRLILFSSSGSYGAEWWSLFPAEVSAWRGRRYLLAGLACASASPFLGADTSLPAETKEKRDHATSLGSRLIMPESIRDGSKGVMLRIDDCQRLVISGSNNLCKNSLKFLRRSSTEAFELFGPAIRVINQAEIAECVTNASNVSGDDTNRLQCTATSLAISGGKYMIRQFPILEPVKNGWAAVGPGWAVHAETRELAIEAYLHAEERHREIDSRPLPVESEPILGQVD